MNKVVQRTRKQAYRLWVNALRSGSYAQGRGCLRSFDGFCCWGVLCDLVARDGGAQWSGKPGKQNYLGLECVPPSCICEFMDISRHETQQLMRMNDDLEMSFLRIADHIETNLMH